MYLVNYARASVRRAADASHRLIFAHHSHISEFANVSWMYRLTFICYLLIRICFLGALLLKESAVLHQQTPKLWIPVDSTLLCAATCDMNVHFYIAATWKSVCIQAIISSQRDGGRKPPRADQRAAAVPRLLPLVRFCSDKTAFFRRRLRASTVHFNQLLTP